LDNFNQIQQPLLAIEMSNDWLILLNDSGDALKNHGQRVGEEDIPPIVVRSTGLLKKNEFKSYWP
jgi:hypothetical protein